MLSRNNHRRKIDSSTWVQFVDDAVCISHIANILGKGMNLTIPPTHPPIHEQIVEQISLFNLDMATDLKEEKLWIQTSWTPF